jgi:hypothetical protein
LAEEKKVSRKEEGRRKKEEGVGFESFDWLRIEF